MFILKKGHQPGVYVPLRALFLVLVIDWQMIVTFESDCHILLCGCHVGIHW